MPQSLILPINQCRVNAGYGSAKYLKTFGFAHYGVDLAAMDGTTDVRACADGEIIACGMDGNTEKERLGNVIVMILRDVRLPDGRITDLACRMFHLASIAVKAGQKVRQGEVIAQYGNTGAHTTGAHLHIEFDTDAAHPSHAFGIGGGGKIVLRGTINSSLNPSKCWFLGAGQRVYTYPVWIEQGYTSKADVELPPLAAPPQASKEEAELSALRMELARLREAAAADRLRDAKVAELVRQLADVIKA